MRNRNLLRAAGALILFILLVAGVTLVLTRPKSVDIANVEPVDDTLANSVMYDSSSLLTVTGGDLVVYNFRDGSRQTITTEAGIESPDSLALSSDKQYIIFHTNFVQQDTQLGSILQSKQASLGGDYWWVYNVKNKQFWYLPEGTIQARFYNGTVRALIANPTGEQLATFSLSGEVSDEAPVAKISDFFPVSDGYLLQTTDGELFHTQEGVLSKKVADSTALVGGTDQQLIITQADGKGQKLAIINLSDYSVKTIAEKTSGKQAWLNSGVLVYGQLHDSTSELHTYDITTAKDFAWAVKNNGERLEDLTPVSAYSSSTALVFDGNDKYWLVSNQHLNTSLLQSAD